MSENSQRVFVTKQPIFMIHDQKANKYDQMFVARTKAEAMRSFGNFIRCGCNDRSGCSKYC